MLREGWIPLPELDFESVAVPESWSITYDSETLVPGVPEILEWLDIAMRPYERRPQATWLNTLEGAGASIPEHNEGRGPDDVTAVLFLDTPDGGALVVGGERVEARAGRYVAFPSSTYHHVEPITGGVRRSLAALYTP